MATGRPSRYRSNSRNATLHEHDQFVQEARRLGRSLYYVRVDLSGPIPRRTLIFPEELADQVDPIHDHEPARPHRKRTPKS